MNLNGQTEEQFLQNQLRDSESHLDGATLSRLAGIRNAALAEKNHWFAEYKNSLMTGLVTAGLFAVMLVPASNLLISGATTESTIEDPLAVLLEDPEFFLWLDEEGLVVAER